MSRMSTCQFIKSKLHAATLKNSGRSMSNRQHNSQADESVSVATLGSFGSASWVAQQFGEEGALRELNFAATSTSDIHQIEESLEFHECLDCSKTFHCASSLHVHVEREHQNTQRGFKCPHCGKGFTRRSEMGRHVGNQHDNRTTFLHCERCPFKHEDPEQFHRHVAEKHKRCKYCRNQFKQLKKHENSCHLKPD